MNSFFVLYKAEIKKILFKKSVWIALGIGMGFVLLVGLTNLSAEGHIGYVKNERDVLSYNAGKEIDDEFLKNFQNEVEAEINNHPEKYDKMMSYDPNVGFMNGANAIGKKALYDFLYNVVRDREAITTITAEQFYEKMRENIIHDGKELGCGETEIDTWIKKYDSIQKPIKYYYAQSYSNIIDVLFLVEWVLFLNIAIALAGVFADEKNYRTDAIILAAKKGRNPICIAKISAGISVALLQTMVIVGGCFGVMFSFFGMEGAKGSIQNIIPSSPWNITIGQMLVIYILIAIITSIFFALTNILLSHVTHSAVATMAIHAAILFVGLFNVPGKLGVIAKLWELRPTMALYYGTFCNTYMYGILNNVEMSLLIYSVGIIIFVGILLWAYKNSQIGSR